MAYENYKTYYLIPEGAVINRNNVLNKTERPVALNIQGDTDTVGFYNNRNVNVWTIDYTTDMQWYLEIPRDAGYARFHCKGNTAYGLDYYYGSNNPGNCDIYLLNGNEEDSKINFRTVSAGENRYRIQCYRNNTDNDLYLTATSFTNGADVRWQALDTSKNGQQIWWLVPIEDVVSNATPSTSYAYPTPSDVRMLSRGFSSNHNGLDIIDEPYTDTDDVPIYAFADGIVSRSKNNIDDEGNTVRIKHGQLFGNGKYIETKYLHMKYRPSLAQGASVNKGDIIGYMGTTGNSTGTHLHFEISYKSIDFNVPSDYYEAEGNYDPIIYLPEYYVR